MIFWSVKKRVSIRRIGVMVLLFAFFWSYSYSQERDATPPPNVRPVPSDFAERADSADVKRENKKVLEEGHSPRKAIVYALVLPGLGQAYNKKYFKIPFVYAALGGVGFWIDYNFKGYHGAVDDYTFDQSTTNERYLKAWRRNLELSFITLAGAYALQTVDAYVDANLFYWDVDPDLTMSVEPYVEPLSIPSVMPVATYGIKARITF